MRPALLCNYRALEAAMEVNDPVLWVIIVAAAIAALAAGTWVFRMRGR